MSCPSNVDVWEADFLRLALRDALATRGLLVERNDLVSRGLVQR